MALLETDKTVRHVFTDDCGDSLRAAVNSGLQAHAVLMGDRQAYVIGDKGMTSGELQTDKLSYTSDRVVYCDPWVGQYVDGQLVEAPSAPFIASVASRVPPSLSIAWKGKAIGEMLVGIKYLVTPRGFGIIPTLSAKGINTIVKEEDGSWRIESDNLASFVSSPATGLLTRRRMTDYIVISGAQALREYVDAPNTQEMHDEEQIVLSNFLGTLKANKKIDQFGLPFIEDFQLLSSEVAAANPPSVLEQNRFMIPFKARTASQQSWIYLLASIGPTVTITPQPA